MRGSSAAVVSGKLKHFSVSQVKDFLLCPRKWYAGKVLGLVAKSKPGAERGRNLHRQPEYYYKRGTPATHGAFLAALPGLPQRGRGLLVEHSLSDPALYVEGVRFEGHSDLIVPPELSPDGIPEVRDWKFTSSFRYTSAPSEDLQMLTYGYWCSKRWPESTRIKLGLHYFEAQGDDFKPRVEVVDVAECEAMWHGTVVPTVKKMAALAAESYTLEQCPDTRGEACWAYGGCHLMEPCGIGSKRDNTKINRMLEDFDAAI